MPAFLGLSPLVWKLLAAGGTALSLPSILKSLRETGDETFGTDFTGRKKRAGRLAEEEVLAALLGSQDLEGEIASQELQGGAMAPFAGVRGIPDDPVASAMSNEIGLRDVMDKHSLDIGRLQQAMQPSSLEEMAFNLGYMGS